MNSLNFGFSILDFGLEANNNASRVSSLESRIEESEPEDSSDTSALDVVAVVAKGLSFPSATMARYKFVGGPLIDDRGLRMD